MRTLNKNAKTIIDSRRRESLIKNLLHNYCTYLGKLSNDDLEFLILKESFTILTAVRKNRL